MNVDIADITGLSVGTAVLILGVRILGQQGAGWKEVLAAAERRAVEAEAQRVRDRDECDRQIGELRLLVERLQRERSGGLQDG